MSMPGNILVADKEYSLDTLKIITGRSVLRI